MTQIALVSHGLTDPALRDDDLPLLVDGLTQAGLPAQVALWTDPSVRWEDFGLVVLRSPWDYPDAAPEFLAWLDRVASVVRVLNAPALVRWNIDKTYLREIAAASTVPLVPTTFCTTLGEVVTALAVLRPGRVVIKPSVSAGSQNTGLFEAGDPSVLLLARQILALGKVVMVQPAIDGVQERGERALLYFNGRFSHAISKGPLLAVGGGLLGGTYVETIHSINAEPAERAVGDALIAAAVTVLLGRGLSESDAVPLYARIDIVDDPVLGPLVLEAELFEPSLFLGSAPDAVGNFVAAVRERLAPEPV
ncbi:ATP-grasp domain-containing protein [Mycetocola sp.]|uniref:ATP-grasp domain-containing protein n=1 Tax=Mycetocola sp. TaxID=1871042 RepID=UPI003989B09C